MRKYLFMKEELHFLVGFGDDLDGHLLIFGNDGDI